MSGFRANTSLSMLPEDVLPSAWVGHLPFAFWIIEEMKPGVLVELGTHNGTSFLAFCQAIRDRSTQTKAFAVDTWQGDEHSGFYGEEVHERLTGLLKDRYSGFAQLMRMRFDEALAYFSDGGVDLLHIDGLHTYEAVKDDFESWLPKMSRRGVVLFHDTMVRERGFGVWRLWEELRTRYPSYEFKHTHGLGVLLVGEDPPPSLLDLCRLSDGADETVVTRLFDALGQRVIHRERVAFLEEKYAEADKFMVHYRTVYERAQEALQKAQEEQELRVGERLAEIQQATARLSGLEQDLEHARVRHADMQASTSAADAERSALREFLDQARSTQALLINQIEASHAQRQAALESSYAERISQLEAEHARRYQELETANAALESSLRDASAAVAELEARERGMQAELERIGRLADDRLEGWKQSDHDHALQVAGLAGQVDVSEAKLGQLTTAMRNLSTELAMARAELRRRDAHLLDAHARVDLRQQEVERLVTSKSWRITAPMRWARARLAALRHGRPAPSYADMLGVPTNADPTPRLPAPLAAEAPALPAAPAAPGTDKLAADYLEELFASDSDRRAPEYVGPSSAPAPRADSLRAKVIAFYLPQFHPFPENEAWWGAGFTEWTNVTKAVPQFMGHHQPRLPADLGFYDLRVPDVLRRQVEMARQYGVHGFAFHYYWFGGKRLMERPLDIFLAQEDLDFPFCLCWANENWTRRWDGHDSEILISQEHGPDNDIAFIQDLEPYLRDRRYIRVDGKPLVIVYRPSILPDAAATVQRWRKHCREAGIGEIYLTMAQFDVEDPREYGFDAAVEFPPHKLAKGFDAINSTLKIVNPGYQGHVAHYQSIVDSAKAWPDKGFPLIRTVFPGWDNEARRPGKGYTFAFSTPQRYRDWLDFAVDYANEHPVAGESIVMVNAWNEWAEGAHLEPDRRYGHAYLQVTREVLEVKRGAARVLVLSHDAHPHGAQYLALNLVKELKSLGQAVSVGLLGPGRLLEDFEALCDVQEAYDETGVAALVSHAKSEGTTLVIANTAVSGRVAAAFHAAGLEVVSLVHELPGVIRQYGLEQAVASLVEVSRKVVVACDAVAAGLDGFADGRLLRDKLVVRPQGLFTRSRYRGLRDLGPARAALRARLGIDPAAKVVVSVGYADLRKGVDLLAEAAVLLTDVPDLHFVWVGHRDVSVQERVDDVLRLGGMQSRFHFVGLDFDTDDYYAGADVYALASREDPFPSVVLESLSVGTPVLAFAGTGGGADLVAAQGGAVVSELTASAYAQALRDLLADNDRRERLGEQGRELVDTRFSFRSYVMDLLALGGLDLPKVSVVVPNYNYARYLRQRLDSIASQTVPVYEIIVLDDASTDDSMVVLQHLRGDLAPEPRIIVNERNSGSVFRQWLKGAQAATGDYIWIAEADDLAKSDFLERLLAVMAPDPGIVMGYTQSEQMDESGKVVAGNYLDYTRDLSATRWLSSYVADGAEEARSGLCIKNAVPNVSAVLFRREALVKVLQDNIDEVASYRIAGDWVVYLRLLRLGKVAFEAKACNQHRRHATSVTHHSAARLHLDEVLKVQREACDTYTPDASVRRAAADYAKVLEGQFGLAGDGNRP
ncbi:glycoside hydrolase family 99-like domain-containing protein [Arenimonas sp. MALMAid1274]|uniref:glycoside hydrolase family 99-like domain-containing protein n=1 Tax=Arenimonas sp. MALMAid1274 TaxID=3411630 RepID=UPI003BA10090